MASSVTMGKRLASLKRQNALIGIVWQWNQGYKRPHIYNMERLKMQYLIAPGYFLANIYKMYFFKSQIQIHKLGYGLSESLQLPP